MDYRLQYNLSRVFGSAKIVQAMNNHLSVISRDKHFPAYDEVESIW